MAYDDFQNSRSAQIGWPTIAQSSGQYDQPFVSTAPARPAGLIAVGLEQIEVQINLAEKELAALAEVLHPVLRAAPPEAAGNGNAPTLPSPLAQRLGDARDRVARLASIIGTIRDRVDL